MKLIFAIILSILSFSATAAQWTPSVGSQVGVVNPGAVPGKNTFISLEDVSFVGCIRDTGALILGDNPNYDEIYSLLLAAKMSEQLVRIYYGGCHGNYAVIQQVYIL